MTLGFRRSPLDPWPTFRVLVVGPINVRAIQENWDETLRQAASVGAVRHLRADGIEVPDELVAHDAPLGWEHIGLTGDYLWGEIDKPRDWFRPLRLQPTWREP